MKLRCGHSASVWREMPSTSAHAYRVECAVCPQHFEKWGTEAELKSLQASGADVTVIIYVDPQAKSTLDQFFEN